MKFELLKILNGTRKQLLSGIIFALAILVSGNLLAQRTITGTITDNAGEPLIGASVVLQGTSEGTITDVDGMFSITANTDDVLVVSYTGYDTQEITVGASNDISVTLVEGLTLGEVIVTGYSVDSRRKISGSVSTVASRDLQIVPSGNVEQQLQGRVPGVTVITNGQPGTTSQVRVRGFGALGGNAPLYVVDGVATQDVEFLSPNDIESTTVLKDATAASIYGARAAGGVIVYTTKRGKRGKQKMKVTYDGLVGVTTPGNGAPILNPQDQATWTWNAIRNAAIQNGETPNFSHPQYGTGDTPVLPDFLLNGAESGIVGSVDLAAAAAAYNIDPNAGPINQLVKTNKQGTDWYDAVTRNALINRHDIGLSGGGEHNRYYVGMGVQQQQGVLLHQKFTRYSFRINTEFDVLPGVRVGENIQGTYRSTRILLGSNGGSGSSDDENIILTTSRMASAIPVFDEFGGYAGTAAPGFNNPENPVANLDGRANDRSFSTSAFGNVYLEYEPIDNLVLRTSFGGRHTSSNSRSFSRQTYENSENNGSFGFSRNTGFNTDWIWTTTINYKRSLGSHNFDLLAGQEALSNGEGRFISASGINPFSQDPNFVNLTTVSNQVVNEFIGTAVRFSSYFGRMNYDFKGKYIASVVIRHDGSSRFGAGNRTGIFPAFSLAWRVSDEKFMKNIGFIDDFKIRGGWGRMGNSNNVNPSNQFSLFGTTIGGSSYDINGTNSSAVQGFFRTRIGNPAAKWETAVTKNVGFDALLFNGKLDIGFEYWRKNTSNLLLQVPVTVMTGPFASAPSVNVGSMLNKGVDFQITNKGKIKELGYEITLTGGFLDNKITSFAPGIDNIPNFSRNFRGVTPILNQVGQPISSFFGFQVQGLFKDQAEVDGAATQDGAAPGRFRFADINGFDSEGNLTGQPDGVIDLADRKALGSPVPDFTGGIALRLNYKHFEVEGYGFLSVGGEIYNMSRLFTDFYPLFPGAAISERVKNSWTFANPTGDIPIFENVSNFSTNTQSSSFFVEDGSYFRMQNITLSYHVPGSILDHLGIGSLRVYASVNNVFTVSNYSGLDPSIGGAADTSFGIDLGNFPITRSWTFGVNMGF